MVASEIADEETKLRGLIENLSAYVEQFHGGTVEFVFFDGETVKAPA